MACPTCALPLLRGDSLAAHLETARERDVPVVELLPGHCPGEPSWPRIVEIFANLADALQVAHDHGFVHRDVKPANLWIDEHGKPLLLDFGLARDRADRYRHLTATGQIVGTPTYLAPEQLDDRFGPVGARADVHGLGASLYEALTRLPPFTGATRVELFANILAGPVPDPCQVRPELPTALGTVVESALARRQVERCASAAAFAADLRRVLAGKPLRLRRWSLRRRLRSWVQQWPARTALLLVLVATIGLAAPTFVRVMRAAADARMEQVSKEALLGPGRLVLARSSLAALPPPWPQHLAALEAWWRDCGLPLLASPADAGTGTELHDFAATTLPHVEVRLEFAAALQARGPEVDAGRWHMAATSVAADGRFQGHLLRPQPGLVPLGADPVSQLEEFYDLASGDPALPVPQRDPLGQLVLADRHGIVFVLLPGGCYRPAVAAQAVWLDPFLIAKHELTRAQYGRLNPGHDPTDVPLGIWNGEMQTLRHPVNRVRFFEAQALLHCWGLQLPTEAQWEYAAIAEGDEWMPKWPGNYRGPEDGVRRAAPVGSYPANAFGLYDMLGNVAEPCADASGTSNHPARHGDGLRAAAPECPRRILRGGGYGSIRWGLTGTSVLEPDRREVDVGLRPVRALENP
jgi:formylglycine-generating enzyme required for sulfatase activity